jgi:hypothetical protein
MTLGIEEDIHCFDGCEAQQVRDRTFIEVMPNHQKSFHPRVERVLRVFAYRGQWEQVGCYNVFCNLSNEGWSAEVDHQVGSLTWPRHYG